MGGEECVWLTDTDVNLSGLDLVGNLFKPKDSSTSVPHFSDS